MPRRLLYYRFRTLMAISALWILLGLVFFENLLHVNNDLGVKVSLWQFAIILGVVGFIICGLLIFYLKPAFNHLPVWLASIIKVAITFIVFIAISFVIFLIYYVFLYHGDFSNYITSFFSKILRTHTFFSFMIDMFVLTLLSIAFLEITDKYGPGMFWSMLIGEYHKPVKENRIFIFLDINDSTTIAEELGHEKYFLMLRKFFDDITSPVLANEGEIYQYVGDEIVLSWLNTPENKIKSLKFLRNSFYLIERMSWKYEQLYKHVPRFKAGVHVGEVTAGFIGIIKKELIYSGDTVNTTARIRSMCHELNERFILSEDFMHDFHQPHGYEIKEIGMMDLKGRLEPIKLYSMNFE
jgi:adenylate cyclase